MKFSLKKAFKFSIWAGLTFALGVGLFVLLVWLEVFGSIPNEEELTSIKNANATLVFSEDEQLLGQFYAQNRTNVKYEALPPHLVDALIATEDARFFEHEGIDYRSLVRVLFRTILLADKSGGGGSTITQQLAKNLFGRPYYGFLSMPVNKVKEMILADRLESLYTKEQIVELYLNTVSFSENTYGIGAGSRRFFGKQPAKLKIEEAAVLVGLLKANTYYNPRLYPEHALERRNVVLYQMHAYSKISLEAKDSLQALPLMLNYQNLTGQSHAPYFLTHVREEASQVITAYNQKEGTQIDLETDGLKIYTSLNFEMQKMAEASLEDHMRWLQQKFNKESKTNPVLSTKSDLFKRALRESVTYKKWKEEDLPEDSLEVWLKRQKPIQLYIDGRDSVIQTSVQDSIMHYVKMLQAGFLAINPSTGAVKVWLGGRNYRFLPYDHVLAKRQAASTFKPIVYATALEQGQPACTYYKNEQRAYEDYDNWSPANYDNKYGGYYSMAGALKKSINVAAVQAIFEAGVTNTLVQSRQMGIESKLPQSPSLALGTGSVSLKEMVQAYGVFANGGYLQPAYMIQRIETANGTVIYNHEQERAELAMNPANAEIMTHMLKGVVEDGTAKALRTKYNLSMPLAGKTGTAQNYTDGWFIGYTPNLVAGIWVGASNPQVHFKGGNYGSGSAMALPIFGKFFSYLQKQPKLLDEIEGDFKALSETQSLDLDCPDFKEDNLVDDFLNLFQAQKGEKVENEKDAEKTDKPNFFERLFKKK